MVLLAAQFGLQPILIREYQGDQIRASIVIVGEGLKVVFALLSLLLSGTYKTAFATWSLKDSVLAAGAPAVVYAFQNIMIQLAYQNMDGLTFNLLNQSKILFTAIILYFLMNKRQSLQQCAALGGLLAASLLLAQSKSSVDGRETSFQYGIVPCMVASMCSGVASGLSQLSLEGRGRNSFLFSLELSVFSILTILATFPFSEDGQSILRDGLLNGWVRTNFIPIIANSAGGIVVGLVMKYAGGVRKGFSIIGGILLTGFAQRLLYNAELSSAVVIALPIVLLSTFAHIRYPYVPAVEKKME